MNAERVAECKQTSADDRLDGDVRRVDFFGELSHRLVGVLVRVRVDVRLDAARWREQRHRYCGNKTTRYSHSTASVQSGAPNTSFSRERLTLNEA